MEYYPRKIEEKLDKWVKREEIILMKGPRQSGKTTQFFTPQRETKWKLCNP